MGAVSWVGLALLAVSMVLCVAAVVAAVRILVSSGGRSPVLGSMGVGQYWRARTMVVRGVAVAPQRLVVVREVAGEMAALGYLALLGAGVSALWVALVLLALSLPVPVLVVALLSGLGVVVAVVMAAGAGYVLHVVVRARRFLAAHREPEVAVGARR